MANRYLTKENENYLQHITLKQPDTYMKIKITLYHTIYSIYWKGAIDKMSKLKCKNREGGTFATLDIFTWMRNR